jgi:6-phosphogluconolactonase
MALVKHEYSDAAALTSAFADKITQLLSAAIEAKGQATLVVSGGRTPVALFQQLAQTPLAWDKVVITLADDRWVDLQDDASNDKLVRTHLLQGHAAAATFITLKHDYDDAAHAVEACEAALADVQLPFDVVILGMGEDGHTASLFPCSAQIEQGLDLTTAANYIAVEPTTAPHQRMSLTLRTILASHNIFLHLVGAAKQDTIAKVLESTEREMPIKGVIDRATVNLMWAP